MSCMYVNNKTLNALISVLINFNIVDENNEEEIKEVADSLRLLNLQSYFGKSEISTEEMQQFENFEFEFYAWDYENAYDILQIAWLIRFLCYQCSNVPDYLEHIIIKGLKIIELKATRAYQDFLIDSGYPCHVANWFEVELMALPVYSPYREMQWGF